jgi:hypothetical protein
MRPQASAMRSTSTKPHLTSLSSLLVSGVGSKTLRSTTSRRKRSERTWTLTLIGCPGGFPACSKLLPTNSEVTSPRPEPRETRTEQTPMTADPRRRWCGGPLPPKKATGRPREFCSRQHREWHSAKERLERQVEQR